MNYELLRPWLFRLDPEVAHRLSLAGLAALARLGPLNPLRQRPPERRRTVMGIDFPNPLGLAAGLDKNGDCIEGLLALGFGFVELGTVTPRPQSGNPKPRMFRLVEQQALINRLGFNNKGIDHLVERVRGRRGSGIVGINLGKNLTTPVESALDDYRIGLRKAHACADYITVNLSSPNTPGLRSLQQGEALAALLRGLAQERARLSDQQGRRVPLAVKIAPDLEPEEIGPLAEMLVRHGVDGVIATNTTLSRAGVGDSPLAAEAGGLSGRPLLEKSTAVVACLAQHLLGALPIIACGGVFCAADARAKLEAGASLVQVYSGFIYRGPALIEEILRDLDAASFH